MMKTKMTKGSVKVKSRKNIFQKNNPANFRTKYFPVVPVNNEIPTPYDIAIAEGTEVNSERLDHFVQKNYLKLNIILLQNPILTPEQRFRIVNHILYTPNSKISIRRKYDSLLIAYKRQDFTEVHRNIVKNEIHKLGKKLHTKLELEVEKRIQELIESNLMDVPDLDERILKQIILIKNYGNVDLPLFKREELELFYKLVMLLKSTEYSIKNSKTKKGEMKHQNDVTFSKLNSILPISELTASTIRSLYEFSQHPIFICFVYRFRIVIDITQAEFTFCIEKLRSFILDFDNLIDTAQEENQRLLNLEQEKSARLARGREFREKAAALQRENLLQGGKGGYFSSIEPSTDNRW